MTVAEQHKLVGPGRLLAVAEAHAPASDLHNVNCKAYAAATHNQPSGVLLCQSGRFADCMQVL
jgi:hypothetical protein